MLMTVLVCFVALAGIAAAYDIARRHLAGRRAEETQRLTQLVQTAKEELKALIKSESLVHRNRLDAHGDELEDLTQAVKALEAHWPQVAKLSDQYGDLTERVEVIEDRPQSASQALTDRVEMHEAALKEALKQIRQQFDQLDGRWAELERKLKTDVNGTLAAATDGFGGTNWRQQ